MDDLLDALGVPLALGQHVVYATAGMHATGRLVPGTILSLDHAQDGEDDRRRERIGICRDDGGVVYIRWSKRVVILRQEAEAEGWPAPAARTTRDAVMSAHRLVTMQISPRP